MQTGEGKCISVMVQSSDTIKHVKAKVKEAAGLPPNEQFTLSLDDELLEDGCTVSSYGMNNGSTLFGSRGIVHVRCVSFLLCPPPRRLLYSKLLLLH